MLYFSKDRSISRAGTEIGPAHDEKELPPTYLPAPVEKETALLVIRPVPNEEELTPVYLLALWRRDQPPLVIGPVPDEEELTPIYLPTPVEKEPTQW